MGQAIARRYKALAALVSGLIGVGAGGAAAGSAAPPCNPEVGDCPPSQDAQGQQVAYAIDQFTAQEQAHGQKATWFLGNLFPSGVISPAGLESRSRRLAQGKVFLDTAEGPRTFAIGKILEAPSGSAHPFVFEGHLIPASREASASELSQPFEFEGRLLPPGPT